MHFFFTANSFTAMFSLLVSLIRTDWIMCSIKYGTNAFRTASTFSFEHALFP